MIRRMFFESLVFSGLVLMLSSGTLGLYFFGLTSWLVGVPFMVGGLLLLGGLVFNFTSLKRHIRSQSTFFWGLTLAKGLLLLLLIGGINWWAVEKKVVWDMTTSQVFTLSQQSIATVEGITKPVTINIFYATTEPERKVMNELLLRYQQHSSLLKVRYFDPSLDFEQANKYKIQVEGTRVVLETEWQGQAAQERFRLELSEGDHEQKITGALSRLSQGTQKTVYFVAGHQESSYQNNERDGASLLYEALLSEGYSVLPLSLNHGQIEIEKNAAILLLGAKRNLLIDEVKRLSDYMASGGRLGLAVEPGQLLGLGGFLGRYGIQVNPDMVVDRSGFAQMYQEGPTTVVASNYPSNHPMTNGLKGAATVFPGVSSISLNPGGEGENSVLVQSGPNAWGERSLLEPIPSAQLRWNTGEVQGPIKLLVANENQESRLWVSSDVDFMTNGYFNLSANRNLALNAIGWLVNSKTDMTIRPHVRGHHRVLLTQKQKEWMAFLLVYLWPLLSLFLGIWISRYRTHRAGELT